MEETATYGPPLVGAPAPPVDSVPHDKTRPSEWRAAKALGVANTAAKPLSVGVGRSTRGAIGANDWFSAKKWYARNLPRRRCQCKLNISEHVDADGPYSLSAEVASAAEKARWWKKLL